MTDQAQFSEGFTPRHDIAVIVACDANYLPYAAVAALQLARAGRDYDVLIGGPEALSLPPVLRDAGIGHVAAVDAAILDALPTDARRSIATYMELFFASALRGVYRRILVLDSDVVFERGDPGRLLSAGMLGHAVAAVRDNRQWRSPRKLVREFKQLGRPAAPYFNAGVVMIDSDFVLDVRDPSPASAHEKRFVRVRAER